MEARDLSAMHLPPTPAGLAERFNEQQTLMFDLMALAYQANMTRVFSMMMAAEVSPTEPVRLP